MNGYLRVLLINGSPKADGCTFTALNEVAKTLNENGIDTEFIHMGDENIRGCIDCRKCAEIKKCVFDDLVNETALRFAECNGLVLSSPVYYSSANGSIVSFLDRLFFSTSFDKTVKVGAAVVSARRTGCSSTFDVLNIFQFPVCPLHPANTGMKCMAVRLMTLKKTKKACRRCGSWV